MASEIEISAMRRALDAADGVARTLPNPRVGCVLLSADGTQLAVGAHHGAGTPHAEVDALSRAGAAARGATAVVTLEPCNHTGRTGPCSQALIDAGVVRVVFAQIDPNRSAAGGAATLRAAGIEVEAGVMAEEATDLNVEWTFALTAGRPFVTWKYAATLDGLSAAPDGSSKWITGEEARRDVQTFRAEADAIVAGTGTVLADDPRLTVRDAADVPLPHEQQALRVVVGETTIPSHYRVFDRVAPTLVVPSRDPAMVLKHLADREIRHVWLEGGPRLAGAFWTAGLIDRVIGYIAPAMLGSGRAALEGEATTLADLRPINLQDLTMIGPDIRIIGTPGRMQREDID
ncbi:bifunctional diaminohydroxyphosphoribosylaminopyrimidine deaminase/5-amino-6-(5-phosphoribosylamino)uracil reductase RibD [Aeromicrobium sp. A1-2]|uniref:bifunctional diaminohydroxyphosphoribosylaminopyrimidine deaminase/5-amino-6-(5-phosphoribosylamino)uracil reductase RibD n=1 Tax=Aeromicrobium sp. A1-2 TaxID=2107713 RepID=UPI000E5209E2|nr:bifunctional diaminohydroxyphosphoribosylaminopyrimidine deaminase/5-amino-6-(5-phosphoribosylamino)uracil reductase RibD [Aeromicrobium sp. A1-2]AXT85301.1 bifunctional diaminohydroxyphosphoribosylaminopyrimidine deaminase/5-amino-6-(5-phosphoribosylamino)uracil reductase RibD [Aeromicrobium sp. A1-2]